jgi:hypothetical protein
VNTIKRDIMDINATQFNTIKKEDWNIEEIKWSIIDIDWKQQAEIMEKIYDEWINPTNPTP